MEIEKEIDISKLSEKQLFELLPPEEQYKRLSKLTPEQIYGIKYNWKWNGRPDQQPPKGDWNTHVILSGRGWGKSKTGSEWVLDKMRQGHKYILICGATESDVINVQVNGPSGIISCCSKYERPKIKDNILYFPNGTLVYCMSGQKPDNFRGKNFSVAWVDELFANFPYPEEAFDMISFGLRLSGPNGEPPQMTITSTPKPMKLLNGFLENEKIAGSGVVITRGTTFDNKDNLAPAFIRTVVNRYEGSLLGRQELYGEVLDDNANALFSHSNIQKYRVPKHDIAGNLIEYKFSRIIIGIDPAVSSNATSDSTGIIVGAKGIDGHYYIIEDATMLAKPIDWAKKAVNLYYKYSADRIVAEVNNGGDLIETTIRSIDDGISYKSVRATHGKLLRAEPISNFYERGLVHHIGLFKELEDQMIEYNGKTKKSPDRLDALVWVLTELTDSRGGGFLEFIDQESELIDKRMALLNGGVKKELDLYDMLLSDDNYDRKDKSEDLI